MLTEKNLNIAAVIAKDLDRQGITLDVKPASVLNPILAVVNAPLPQDAAAMESHELTKAMIRLTRSLESDGVIAYDMAMDNVVAQLAPMMKRYLSVMHTVVNPFIRDLATAVADQLDNKKPEDLHKVKIEETPLPALLMNSSFIELLNKFKSATASSENMPLRPVFPELDAATIKKHLYTFTQLESDITSWITSVGDDSLVSLYNSIFKRGLIEQGNLGYIFTNTPNALDLSMLTFLLSSAFVIEPIDNVVGTLQEYQDTLSLLRGQSALALINYKNRIEHQANTGVLLDKRVPGKLIVNPISYERYMNEGGDVEALYSNTLRTTPLRKVEELLASQEELVASWRKFSKENYGEESLERLKLAKFLLLDNFTKLLDKYSDKDGENDLGRDNQSAITEFKRLLDYVTVYSLSDIFVLSLKLVCKSKYPNLDAESFLLGIDKAKKANPDISVREAALISTIGYLAKWIASDIVIKK